MLKSLRKRSLIILISNILFFYCWNTFKYKNNFFNDKITIGMLIYVFLFVLIQIVGYFILKYFFEKQILKMNLGKVENEQKTHFKEQIQEKFNFCLKIHTFLLLFLSLIPLKFSFDFEHNTIYINNEKDFVDLYDNKNANYELKNDIRLTIDYKEYKEKRKGLHFEGNFDGNGFKIYNLNSSLFTQIHEKSIIKNLILKDVSINDKEYIGGTIAEYNYGIILNCDVYGKVEGKVVGGIILCNEGQIDLSSFNGEILSFRNSAGIAAINTSQISRSFVTGKIFGEVNPSAIFSSDNGVATDCYTNVILESKNMIGTVGGKYTKSRNVIVYGDTKVIGENELSKIFLNGINEASYNLFLGNFTGEIDTDDFKVKTYISQKSNLKIENDLFEYIEYEELLDIYFYKSLNYSEDIWDFSHLKDGYGPILKGKDNQELIKI